jgi:plasmid stabilization system protein ParE
VSAVLVRSALEVALAAMSPSIGYAWENTPYSPVVGSPYARVNLLLAEPANPVIGTLYTEQGFLQVSLAYPLDDGPAAAAARADLIRTTFHRGASFTASGVTVNIERTPEISPAQIEPDRYILTVKIRFYAHIAS